MTSSGSEVRPERRSLDSSAYWIAGPLLVIVLCGSIGVVLSPQLLVKQPLLLIGLSPLVRHLFFASPSIDTTPFILVAVLRLFAPDPFVYLLGRKYGNGAVRWIEQRSTATGRVVRWLERIFIHAWVLAVFVSPGYTVCTLAGAARIPFWRFALVNLLGTLSLVLAVRYVAGATSRWIAVVVRVIEDSLGTFTAISVLLAFAGYFLWRRRIRADVASLSELGKSRR